MIMSGANSYCDPLYIDTLGIPFIIVGEVLTIVGMIILFANADIFRRWLRFSVYYVPIAVLLTLWMYPTLTPLGGVVPISQGARLFGTLYAILSAGIVIVSYLGAWMRKEKGTPNKA